MAARPGVQLAAQVGGAMATGGAVCWYALLGRGRPCWCAGMGVWGPRGSTRTLGRGCAAGAAIRRASCQHRNALLACSGDAENEAAQPMLPPPGGAAGPAPGPGVVRGPGRRPAIQSDLALEGNVFGAVIPRPFRRDHQAQPFVVPIAPC